jgi:hypothetical protein
MSCPELPGALAGLAVLVLLGLAGSFVLFGLLLLGWL